MTKLDVLDEFSEIKICVAYEIDGKIYDKITDPAVMQRAKPRYEILSGWMSNTTGIRNFAELPLNAQRYLQRIEELVGKPVEIISVGPERGQTIYRRRT